MSVLRISIMPGLYPCGYTVSMMGRESFKTVVGGQNDVDMTGAGRRARRQAIAPAALFPAPFIPERGLPRVGDGRASGGS
jgi:hypothetical protein